MSYTILVFAMTCVLFPAVAQNAWTADVDAGNRRDASGAASRSGGDNELELDNGILRVRVDLLSGGALTYLSLSAEDRNLVNNHDRGRQIQQSYYAGEPVDRTAEGQHPAWSPWAWNPIQVGDTYGNSSEVIEHSKDGATLYTKTIPLLWDMNDESAEAYFEQWTTLEGNLVHVRNKLTCFRTDDRWPTRAAHQELPAVYTIGDLFNLYTYAGPSPFTYAPLTSIENSGPPWAYWGNTEPHEKWAALVDDSGWGVGVYNADTELFVGGLHGTKGGGTHDGSTGYISPLRTETLGKNTVYEYEYTLIVGTLAQIRAWVYTAEGFADTDGDGIADLDEVRDLDPGTPGIQNPFDPARADSTGNNFSDSPDGRPDGLNDYDGDGVSNADEFAQGTNPISPDRVAQMGLPGWPLATALGFFGLRGSLMLRG